MKTKTNKILETHKGWLLVDISTPKFPAATMAVDTDVFEAHAGGRIYAAASSRHKYIYASYRSSKTPCRLFHQDVLAALPPLEADHIQHGTRSFVDNRRRNLRAATRQQNSQNRTRPKGNTPGIKGVRWHKAAQKWYARIEIGGKGIPLGFYDNIEIAIGARQQAEREYFGEFAYRGEE